MFSVRAYKYDPQTFEVLDYIQWNTDLVEANKNGKIDFRLFYTAKDAYGLDDLSAASWSKLVDRMKSDDSLFQKYWLFYNGNVTGTGPCLGSCKKEALCSITSATHAQLKACLGL